VAGDEVYGNDPALRATLHERGVGYVLAVARDHRVRTHAGTRRAVDLAVTLPTSVWQTHSAGRGSKGHRWYARALVHLDEADLPGQQRLLIRPNLRTGELAFYRCWSPTPVPLAAFVRVAGTRWRIEENIRAGTCASLPCHWCRRPGTTDSSGDDHAVRGGEHARGERDRPGSGEGIRPRPRARLADGQV
jgi:SRSO17 transposase